MSFGTIEIRDRNSDGLPAVELGDILPLVEAEGRGMTWAILNLYAVGDLRRLGRTMRDFGDEIGNSPHGALLNWDELEEFSRSVFQIMDAVIVGCRSADAVPDRQRIELAPGRCELVIEAIDASRWRVSAAAPATDVVARFKDVFKDWHEPTDQD